MSLGVDGILRERVLRLVGDALRGCEAEIERELAGSPVQLDPGAGQYVALAGGKRLRPILVLLWARAGRRRGPLASARLGASSSSSTRRP